jgi:hypothetical protein
MQIASTSYSAEDWNIATSNGGPVVGDIVWRLANTLWRIFAQVCPRPVVTSCSCLHIQRQLHTQATELIRSISSLQPAEEKRINARASFIRSTDICQSYYWRGRLGVKLLDMRNAKYWLDKAWSWCPEESWQQRRYVQYTRKYTTLIYQALFSYD